ncbi:MAG: lipopolysaccharide kinase InaA family protein [Candidatus Bathyarchaeia archaeon]
MSVSRIDEDERSILAKHCERISDKYGVRAACVSDIACEESGKIKYFETLVILDNYLPTANITFRRVKNNYVKSILIDSKIFESDVKKGLLGEALSEKITFFYIPLRNESYLKNLELELKKRLIREEIERLVIEYPEVYKELLIRPEYFPYNIVYERCKFTSFLSYKFSRFMRATETEKIEKNFLEATQKLVDENLLFWHDGYLKIVRTPFIDEAGIKDRITHSLKSIRRTLLRYSLGSLSDTPSIFFQTLKFGKVQSSTSKLVGSNILLEDPQKYVFIPTSRGLIPLSESTTLQETLRKKFFRDEVKPFTIEKIGGIINSVYLVKWWEGNTLERVVVKKFSDWVGLKWFLIALWAFGTKDFIVSGRKRLGREYTLNNYLLGRSFPVPRVLYVNLKDNLLVSEYIDGISLIEIIKSILSGWNVEKKDILKKVGKTVASAHKIGVALGDCKPENFIVTDEGKVYFVDLEQATLKGDYSWDVAEILYYSGHYLDPFTPVRRIDPLVKEFISGYIEGGGDPQVIRRASSLRFIKVFSFFTLPGTLLRIAELCKTFS